MTTSQQAPDYRLYKSEPELTTVKEEVDEANADDKDKIDNSTDSKDATASKGTQNIHTMTFSMYVNSPSARNYSFAPTLIIFIIIFCVAKRKITPDDCL